MDIIQNGAKSSDDKKWKVVLSFSEKGASNFSKTYEFKEDIMQATELEILTCYASSSASNNKEIIIFPTGGSEYSDSVEVRISLSSLLCNSPTVKLTSIYNSAVSCMYGIRAIGGITPEQTRLVFDVAYRHSNDPVTFNVVISAR